MALALSEDGASGQAIKRSSLLKLGRSIGGFVFRFGDLSGLAGLALTAALVLSFFHFFVSYPQDKPAVLSVHLLRTG